MAKGGSRLGWWIAGAVALAWWYSSGDDARPPPAPPRAVETRAPPAAAQPPRQTQPERNVALPQREVPDDVARPSPPAEVSVVEQVLYTTTRVRLRAEPSTSAEIVATLEPSQEVRSVALQSPWHRVNVGRQAGWVHGDYLTRTRPVARQQRVRTPVAPLVRQAPARSGTGAPLRDPYVGRCDCPYDLMRNGRRCGGNSAYSRPGGRNPVCYR